MYKKLIAWTLLLIAALPAAQAEQEFLKPDQAFVISAQSSDGKTVQVNWEIAKGYYLYQSKFRFLSDSAGVEFGDPDLPPALTKNDPIFGEVEIYRDQVSIEVPLVAVPGNTEMLTLKARSQGCADDGICYPPHTQTVLVALSQAADSPPPVDPRTVENFDATGSAPPAAEAVETLAVIDEDPLKELAALGEDLGLDIGEDDILAPEDAFRVSANGGDGTRLQVQWTIAEGTYLYQDKIKLELGGDGVQLGEFELPPPEIKKDSIKPDGTIGDVAVYHDRIDLDIPLVRTNTDATEVALTASYQGCADRGICYPPQKTTFKLGLPAASGAATVAATPAAAKSIEALPAAEKQSEQDQIAGLIAVRAAGSSSRISSGIGLRLAFTPCVFPMIPILSGIISRPRPAASPPARPSCCRWSTCWPWRSPTPSPAYSRPWSARTCPGHAAEPGGDRIFAAVFVALALSMFGFYELQLPSGLQSKLTEISNRQEGGSLHRRRASWACCPH